METNLLLRLVEPADLFAVSCLTRIWGVFTCSILTSIVTIFIIIVIIHGQAKKVIRGANSQGSTPKICRPPSAAKNFSRQPRRPWVENDQNRFTHGIPMGYSQGSFVNTLLPGLTPQGSFSGFFLNFSEFS